MMHSNRSRSVAASLLLCSAIAIACTPDKQEAAVDLVVRLVSAPASVQPGGNFEVVTRACNRGNALWSGPTEVEHFVREVGAPGSPSDPFIGLRPVPPLAPGACDEQSYLATAPTNLPSGAYRVVARVDPYQNSGEAKPDNNVRYSHAVGIGWGPDLVVGAVSGAPSALPGGDFAARVEVCNEGTDWSFASNVSVYLSQDAVVDGVLHDPSSTDWLAGTLPVPGLAPGLCTPVEGLVAAGPTSGALHLGAIVDENEALVELIEFNNDRIGGLIGIGNGPDLVVAALDGPPSTLNWSDFDVHTVVCNQGTAPSGPGAVSLYFSADSEITPALNDPAAGDPFLTMVPMPPLDPRQCHAADLVVHASAPFEGAWYLGAVVDETDSVPELLESNNHFTAPLVGVGTGPDLVVSALLSAPSVEPAGPLDVDAEVCNRGTDMAGPSELRLYLSADLVLDGMAPGGPPGADPEIGGIPLPILSPGECWSGSLPGYPPALEEGAYHLVGAVDESGYVAELIESNNVRFGGPVGVGYAPDLIVTDLTAPASARLFDPFTAGATVCNQGTTASPPAWLAFYHSADTTLTGQMTTPAGPDPLAGNAEVPFLEAGACAAVTAMLAGNVTTDGAYYLGAIVDEYDDVPELFETNNAHLGPLMGMGDGPDLVVEQLDGPPTAAPGEWIDVDLEVCNRGTFLSVPTLLHLYASPDASIGGQPAGPGGGPPSNDHPLGPVSVPSLMAGQCHAALEAAALPPAEMGVFTLGAVVDEFESVPELIETNNAFTGDLIGVGWGPDLVVTSLVGPPSADEASAFPVEVEVCNQGNGPSSFSTVTLYLSDDTEVDGSYYAPGDPTLADLPLPSLDPGACHTEPFDAYAAVPQPGAWYLAAYVDEGDYVPELLESNNTLVGPLMGIGSDPDLVITSITAPPSALAGLPFPVDAEVCNQGTSFSTATYLALYHSLDSQVTGDFESPGNPDFAAAMLPVPPLAPGGCAPLTGSGMAAVPSAGAWYLGGIVDEPDQLPELIETNNRLVGVSMDISLGP